MINPIGINLIFPDFVFFSFLFFAFVFGRSLILPVFFDFILCLFVRFLKLQAITGGHLTWGLVVSSRLWSVHGPGPSAHVTMSKHVIINSLVKLGSKSCPSRIVLSSSSPGHVQLSTLLSNSGPGHVQAAMCCQA